MRRLSIALVAGHFVLGCATPVTVPGKTPTPVAVAVATPWRTNLLATQGITIEMPGVAEEKMTTKSLGEQSNLYYQHIRLTSDEPALHFEAGVYSAVLRRGEMSLEEMIDEARGSMTRMERRRETKFGDFDGVAMTGTTDDGKFVAMRAYWIGDHLYNLRVEGESGATTERDAERFFASFRLQMPFRLFVSSADYYSIAKPFTTKYKPLSHKLPDGSTMVIHLFSYTDEDGYSMSVVPTADDTNDEDVAEEVLDNAAAALGKKEGSIIERMASVTVEDAQARDIIYKNAQNLYSRGLLVIKNRRMYIATRTAPERSKMEDTDATMFFESLTIGRAP